MVAVSLHFLTAVGGVGPIAAAMISLPAFWVLFWTLSYSAACCMTILEGTGAGQVVIDEWPEPDWREWAVNLLFLAFVGLLAQGVSVLAAPVLQFMPSAWLISLAQVHVLYPIILLSALEAGTIFWPFSPPVYQSMRTHARYWLLYFLLSAIVSAVYVVSIYYSIFAQPFLCALWAGPLTTTMLFIQARLLGRLGWRVIVEPDGGQKRMENLAKIKQYKDEPFGKFEPVAPKSGNP